MNFSSSFLLYKKPQAKCKIHWEYQGLAVPINNCSNCWAYYSHQSSGGLTERHRIGLESRSLEE